MLDVNNLTTFTKVIIAGICDIDKPDELHNVIFKLRGLAQKDKSLLLSLKGDLEQALLRCLKLGKAEMVEPLCKHVDMYVFVPCNNIELVEA